MPCTRITATAAMVALLLAGTVACSGDDGPEPLPPVKATNGSPTTSPSTTAPSTSDPPEGYSRAQRQAYRDAMSAYQHFTDLNDSISATGKATPDALRVYKRLTDDWKTYWASLQQSDSYGVRIKGQLEVLSSRPTGIKLSATGGDVVTVRQCVDASDVRVFQHGKRLSQPQNKHPYARVVIIDRFPDAEWKVGLEKRVRTKC